MTSDMATYPPCIPTAGEEMCFLGDIEAARPSAGSFAGVSAPQGPLSVGEAAALAALNTNLILFVLVSGTVVVVAVGVVAAVVDKVVLAAVMASVMVGLVALIGVEAALIGVMAAAVAPVEAVAAGMVPFLLF
jgi:hypothetical protein